LDDATTLWGKGKLDVDSKKAEKANDIVKNKDHVKALRVRLLNAEKTLEEKEEYFETKMVPLQNEQERFLKEEKFTEEAIRKVEDSIKSIENEIDETKKEKEKLHQELKFLLSQQLNAKIV